MVEATQPSKAAVTAGQNRAAFWSAGFISLLLAGLWCFPAAWYTRTDAQLGYFWLGEQTNVTSWAYQEIPVSKAAEATLVADRLVNGEYTGPNGKVVRVFSAKRYVESQNEIGLFVHTPDRCWTESGWRMEPVQPDSRELTVHGIPLVLERRVFSSGTQRELVYFAGMVGGQPLPYRLDHNLSVGMKHALRTARDQTGTSLRASDQRFWRRVWDSFLARRPLTGPKQFIRISTPADQGELAPADALLEQFIGRWLQPVGYEVELSAWGAVKAGKEGVTQ